MNATQDPPRPPAAAEQLLNVRDLRITYRGMTGPLHVVDGVDLDLAAGNFLGIVGESGSGKTQLLLALLGLNAGARLAGSIRYRGEELLGAPERSWRRLRGANIGMIFQDPMTALNPYLPIGTQLTEGARRHRGLSRAEARQRALEMLDAVQIAEPRRRMDQHPHELSGGMRQRIVIAMAMISEPEIILADEPTTALDATVQAQILTLLRELGTRTRVAVVLVSHDLGVIAEVADRVAVMYAGRIVEQADAPTLFTAARHPYTEGLRRSIVPLDGVLPARLPTIGGLPPNVAELPPGCAFAPRCGYAWEPCGTVPPPLTLVSAPGAALAQEHRKACYHEGPLGQTAPNPRPRSR